MAVRKMIALAIVMVVSSIVVWSPADDRLWLHVTQPRRADCQQKVSRCSPGGKAGESPTQRGGTCPPLPAVDSAPGYQLKSTVICRVGQ